MVILHFLFILFAARTLVNIVFKNTPLYNVILF
jgi:hypothetical protein